MTGRQITDREAYPAAWVTLAFLGTAFLFWKYGLGRPGDQPVLDLGALASVLPWLRRYPGSDRTGAWTAAAVTLLSSSRSVTAVLATVYMISQTLWRMRGRQGWVLRYDHRWPAMVVGLFLANLCGQKCIVAGIWDPDLTEKSM